MTSFSGHTASAEAFDAIREKVSKQARRTETRRH